MEQLFAGLHTYGGAMTTANYAHALQGILRSFYAGWNSCAQPPALGTSSPLHFLRVSARRQPLSSQALAD